MPDFKPQSICILGRQPALGAAELESVYGSQHIRLIGQSALLDIPAEKINFKQLGGTVKTARLLAELPYLPWPQIVGYLKQAISEHLQHIDGKLTLGLSTYGLSVSPQDINRALMQIKKAVKQTGRPIRTVPNKASDLSSAQVLHNKLTHIGGWELLLIRHRQLCYLAQTLFVQDIESYSARDQSRPARDAKAGMLPPKLGQIIINLAAGPIIKKHEAQKIRLLDPFCGSGVILQEALLMGMSVLGTDISSSAIKAASTNLKWLYKNHPSLNGHVSLEQADATSYQWPKFSVLASEIDLGQPLSNLPGPERMGRIIKSSDKLLADFLKNLARQSPAGLPVCLAVPAWSLPGGKFKKLPVIDHLTDMGYTYWDLKTAPANQLIYHRPGQTVARQLLRLKRV